MASDLESLFAELANTIPIGVSDRFVFTSQVLPVPPPYLITDRLLLKKGAHDYDSNFRADVLQFHFHQETCRNLGLLILSIILHPEPAKVHLELTHPASDIKNLIIEFDHKSPDRIVSGYHYLPYDFVYSPNEVERHPWFGSCIDPSDLPKIYLTNLKRFVVTDEDWKQRDTIIGFGGDRGSVLFAELLLNAGRLQSKLNEYHLEGEAGVRGVGPMSAEVTLFLPGSFGWNPEFWQ